MTHIKTKFQTTASDRGQQRIRESVETRPAPKPRIPHITKLMALAIRLDHLLATGQVKDQVEIARLAGITRARVTQILNLTNLAPDIQQAILGFDTTPGKCDPCKEHEARAISIDPNWQRQRRDFRRLAHGVV